MINKISLSIILPVYNEAENITQTLEDCRHFLNGHGDLLLDYEVIVVNDGSSDNTSVILNDFKTRLPHIQIITHTQNLGYGAALLSGCKKARFPWILMMDADGQFKMESLKALLAFTDQYEVVAGYRAKRMDPLNRILLGRTYTFLACRIFGFRLKDINCGFKLFKKETLNLNSTPAHAGAFYTSIFKDAVKNGCRIKEVPVRHFPRVKGRSTGNNIKVVWEAIWDVFKLKSTPRLFVDPAEGAKHFMAFNFMKHIDYWCGVPICFLLTLTKTFWKSLETPTPTIPQKILFIKPSEMGAIVLSSPLIEQVRKNYPKAQLYFLTFAVNKPVLEVLNTIDCQNVLTIRGHSLLALIHDTLRVIIQLRKIKIDTVLDLEFFSRFTTILSFLCGAPIQIGYYAYSMKGLYRGELLTHKIPYNPHRHVSESYLSMAQALSHKSKSNPEMFHAWKKEDVRLPFFKPSAQDIDWIKSRLQEEGVPVDAKLFLINPGEGRIPLREWPLENFTLLSHKILEDPRHVVIITGALENTSKSNKLFTSVNNSRCFNLCGKTSLKEILTLCHLAQNLITNDCGLAHLASLTPIDQFVLFGPESPHVFGPLKSNVRHFYAQLPCSPCLSAFNHRTSACKNNRCLKNISLNVVWETLREDRKDKRETAIK